MGNLNDMNDLYKFQDVCPLCDIAVVHRKSHAQMLKKP